MLSREEWISHDLVGLAGLAASGELSRREITETAIREIEAQNSSVNAVVLARYEQALEAVCEGPEAQRFSGLPYLIKDLHAPVMGLPLSNGSVRFKDTEFDFDSTTVSRLRASGLAFLGRSASPEFGLTLSTESALNGVTRNPWNLDYSAGGSSGGAAAAVASGMMPAAHATDSAGSIRIPAACNGLVGLKPSRGVNATGPHRGDPNFGMSHEHAVTRTVRDSAALLDITSGPDAGCPYFTPVPDGGFERLLSAAPKRLKIGFLCDRFDGEPIHKDSADAVSMTANKLEELGHTVEETRPEFDFKVLSHEAFRLLVGSLAGFFPPEFAEGELDGLEPMTNVLIRYAASLTVHDYLQRAAIVNAEVRKLSAFFETHDVLLCATSNGPARLSGTGSLNRDVTFDDFTNELMEIAPFTVQFNASGAPAMNLPVHQSDGGLPVGVQIISKLGNDGLILQLAHELEMASAWKTVAPTPN